MKSQVEETWSEILHSNVPCYLVCVFAVFVYVAALAVEELGFERFHSMVQ